jgi:hypothetical protein
VIDVCGEGELVPGRVPPSVTVIDPDKGVGEAVEVDGMEQLGVPTPGGQEVTVITLVVKITVVDRSEADSEGKGTTVGGWDAWPEKLGPGRGVAKIVPLGDRTSSAESCTFPSS